MFTRRQLVLGMLAFAASARAQELAHAGWRGNGIAPEAWWKHAVFVRFPQDTTFATVSKAFDVMAEVNADSILLPDLEPTATAPFNERFGTEEELDALLREAAARRMHVLVRIPLQRALASSSEVRFWMTRGVSGVELGTIAPGEMESARTLRASLDQFPGERILMARGPGPANALPSRSRKATPRDPITLHILSVDDLATADGGANSVTELVAGAATPQANADSPAATLPGAVPRLASLLPLLLSPGAPVLDSRLLDTSADRAGIRDVLALRNTHAMFRTGTVRTLATGQANAHAWVVKGKSGRDALLLVSNTGDIAVTLHLASAVAAQGLRGSYVRALLRSDNAMGAWSLQEATLPAGSAIVGEIRSDGYAAPVALDPDAPPPGTASYRPHRRRRK